MLGWAVYAASPTYRRHLKENLALAYPPQEAAAILPRAVAQTGRALMELPHIWLRPEEETLRLVQRVTGWEAVEAARRQGARLIFLTPHLGCFEITARYCAVRLPLTVLYRPPKQAWLRPIVERGRGGGSVRLASADAGGVRRLMRALKNREAIGILPDQVPGNGEGTWASFFGRPAYTMTLAARLSELDDVQVLLCYTERLPGGEGFHMHFMPPPVPIAGALHERVEAINRGLEELIRLCPEQYLWGYNRYKVPAGAPSPASLEAERA